MLSKKSAVPFRGTKEQEEELLKVIEELKDEKGALMPIMQRAQDIYGYLPIEVQKIISDLTGIPLEKIYGVATFYAQFNLSPKGRYQISVCLGTGMLCKRIRRYLQQADGKAWYRGRRVYAGWKIFAGCVPLYRGLWTGAGHDDQ